MSEFAGIHRLFSKLDVIRGAKVVIVIAGMEGAWPAWWEDWWTSGHRSSYERGYGSNFGGGRAAFDAQQLASGVSSVNIATGSEPLTPLRISNKL